jgi:hypothetical protein
MLEFPSIEFRALLILPGMHRKYYGSDHDISEDEDDLITAVYGAVASYKRRRNAPLIRKRLKWMAHVKQLHREGQFNRMYRMSYKSFRKLLSLLSPYLMVDAKQGSRRNHGMGHVTPELVLHCLLRYLAGGSHHDIRVLAGIAKSTFHSGRFSQI